MEFLHNNPFASGLVFTTLIAAILAYARNVPKKLLAYFWTQFAVCAEIKSTDPAFSWIAMWLDHQPYSKKTRRLSVQTYYKSDDNEDDGPCAFDVAGNRRKKNRPKILFTPATGQHIFWYKGRFIWLSRSQTNAGNGQGGGGGGGGGSSGFQLENFYLWVLGRKQTVIREILKEAMQMAMPEGSPETWVIPSAEGRWQGAVRRKPRTRDSVILDGSDLDYLVTDASNFLKNKDWYDALGIPYRRGYLLHGVPGSGKTSAVLAVAGELGLDVYMLNLGDRYLDDGRLNYLLSQVPAGNIVLLEDIDAAFKTKKEEPKVEVIDDDKQPPKLGIQVKNREMDSSSVSFSGLLNALDGVAAREGRILFMTTNHKDSLDPALIRPGRADVHKEFGHATSEQAQRMFQRFFPKADTEDALKFGHATPRNSVSMAVIQDHLLTHKDDPTTALAAWINQNKGV
jgi:chaperone BCS1